MKTPQLKVSLSLGRVRDSDLRLRGCELAAMSSSKRVPTLFATERDSNSLTDCTERTYGFRKTEYCNEEGSFRGAFLVCGISADPRVY